MWRAGLAVLLVATLSGCAIVRTTKSITRTVGTQAGQPVDITTTTSETSESQPEVPAQALGLLGLVSSMLTGPNMVAGGGLLALVAGWLREAKHSKRHQDDADEGWAEIKRLAVAEGHGTPSGSASPNATPLPSLA